MQTTYIHHSLPCVGQLWLCKCRLGIANGGNEPEHETILNSAIFEFTSYFSQPILSYIVSPPLCHNGVYWGPWILPRFTCQLEKSKYTFSHPNCGRQQYKQPLHKHYTIIDRPLSTIVQTLFQHFRSILGQTPIMCGGSMPRFMLVYQIVLPIVPLALWLAKALTYKQTRVAIFLTLAKNLTSGQMSVVDVSDPVLMRVLQLSQDNSVHLYVFRKCLISYIKLSGHYRCAEISSKRHIYSIKAQGLNTTTTKMLHCIYSLTLRLMSVHNNNMVIAWATLCPHFWANCCQLSCRKIAGNIA